MLATNRNDQLEELLGTSIAAIDIPDAIYDRAVARYEAVGSWLSAHWPGHVGGEIYPQGSFRLGTVVAPIAADGEYDMDLVCRRDISKASTTQRALKGDVGGALRAYVASGAEGNPEIDEGKRCWTLDYPHEPFHMDILPALPDVDGAPNAILLTDREFREWHHSNPIDYALWFHRTMERERELLREAIAKRMDVEDVPDAKLKTTLQRTVQALKRHRDLRFADAPEHAPASIIITTLAARAYEGGGTLYEVLMDVTGRMAEFVEDRAGVYWIPNPVLPEENFADRWRGRPQRVRRFFDWLVHAEEDFSGIGTETGVDQVLEKLSLSLGQGPARHAGERLGVRAAKERDARRLRMSRTGLLGAPIGVPVPRHSSTAMRRRPAGRSVAQQAFALRELFPDADISLTSGRLRWTGSLTPSSLSRTYLVELTYRPGHMPEVRVLEPVLEPRLADSLPHVYRGGVLCLHRAEDWDHTMLLAATIIPWASEWLYFYEIWKATGEWHGGGEWPPVESSDSAPTTAAEQEDGTNMAYDGLPSADV